MDVIVVLELWILSIICILVVNFEDFDDKAHQERSFLRGLIIVLFAPFIAIYELISHIGTIKFL